ncbi:MAG TPA: gluconate 2-dehydrogenase subunit 3 family protein [Niabella sp.]|jgi:hypothetical protein|nr:gluconate 2-dehydrogenase subunit 3 family protein [Chitinophagaceae bacterium]HRN46746.1 gluconate 2-dehydrogenase subunit 3 family protein [Niabella sp.]HRO84051.1 gluconate 2-dehydrogenase subunit 3 family protein [Niabella sp.]
MNRRELLKNIVALTGFSLIGGEFLISGCKNEAAGSRTFTDKDLTLLNEIGETIIPATDTPGAKAANVAQVMKDVVSDCYYPAHQKAFFDGIKNIDIAAKNKFQKDFLQLNPEQRHKLLVDLEKEAKAFNEKRNEADKIRREKFDEENQKLPPGEQKLFQEAPPHYYTLFKQLTLLGFFTSETGLTETLRHISVPGRYDGDVPYKKGMPAWE